MRHTLHSHIIYLENMIQSLRDRLTGSHLATEDREGLETQIYHAQVALAHYRKAYAHELSASNPEAPGSPGSMSEGENGKPTKSKSENKKKDGSAAVPTRNTVRARVRLSRGFPGYLGSASAHPPSYSKIKTPLR